MMWRKRGRTTSWIGITACLLACCRILFSPATASAHAILLRSNPPIGAVLKSLPTQVQMWFSEDLNPTFTTASVLDVSKDTTQTPDDRADLQLPSWSQAFTTIYGHILLVKIGLVGGLLLTSAVHVFWLRPRLKKHTSSICLQ